MDMTPILIVVTLITLVLVIGLVLWLRRAPSVQSIRHPSSLPSEASKTSISHSIGVFDDHLSQLFPDPSYVYSPLSVYYALSLLFLGARGSTQQELSSVLNFPGGQLLGCLQSIFPTEGGHLSNVLLHRSTCPIEPPYLRLFTQQLHGSVVPFTAPQEAVEHTNTIVNRETHGLIPVVLQPSDVTESTMVILLNIIYFKALWVHAFTETREQSFGGTRQVPMMHQTNDFLYHEDASAQYLVMPYTTGDLAMVVALPKAHASIPPIRDLLLQPYQSREVVVSFPQFTQRFRTELTPLLRQLGVSHVFSDQADLSGLAKGIHVDQIIHEAVVKVDEVGTEAVAVTVESSLSMSMETPEIKFTADHPFRYAIVHVPNRLVIFNGVYN
jgi:serpin B